MIPKTKKIIKSFTSNIAMQACSTLLHWNRNITEMMTIQFQYPPKQHESYTTHDNFYSRADSRFASSQWETVLLCNDVSHWLGANLEPALYSIFFLSKKTWDYYYTFYWILSHGDLSMVHEYLTQWSNSMETQCNNTFVCHWAGTNQLVLNGGLNSLAPRRFESNSRYFL